MWDFLPQVLYEAWGRWWCIAVESVSQGEDIQRLQRLPVLPHESQTK